MNVKSFVTLEVIKNDHVFTFNMPIGVPYGEAYDAAYECLQNITELAQKAADAAKPQEVPADSQATPVEAEVAN